jgi:hypothetical protein
VTPVPSSSVSTVAGVTLTAAWYLDRLDGDWQPHTVQQNEAILDRPGLPGEFWRTT